MPLQVTHTTHLLEQLIMTIQRIVSVLGFALAALGFAYFQGFASDHELLVKVLAS